MTAPLKKVPSVYAPRTAAEAALLLVQIAASQIGYREGRSKSGDWNNDTMFGVWYGMNHNAWCAMFVSWCASVAQFGSIIPKHAYTPSGFNWFASRGLADGRKPPNRKGAAATGKGKPRVGDVMYVYSTSMGRISHVGIVEKVLSGGYVQTVEGNTDTGGSAQGNGVYRLKRQVTSRLYFCHPNYAAVVTKAPAKPPAAKPTDTPTPPREQDWLDMASKEEVKEAFTEALQAVIPATEKLYVNADNRYEAQAESYFAVAQAYAAHRIPELLAAGKGAREAMDAVRLEVVPFLSPLWATAKK